MKNYDQGHELPRLSLLKGFSADAPETLPVSGQFSVVQDRVYLNNARRHPLSRGAGQARADYLGARARGIWTPTLNSPESLAVRKGFADLIGALPAEIAFVNSTRAGENLIVKGLGLDQPGKHNIVTDALHYDGSLRLYVELQKRGVDVRILEPENWRIRMSDMEAAIDSNTRLVALSRISFINGLEHNLKTVCDLAHARGAFVYADVVQSVGCMPLDVRESGVDFVAAATYKWLMGDYGLGFLYVRQDVLSNLQRSQWSCPQIEGLEYNTFPGDASGPFPATSRQREDAAGQFEVGTDANGVLAALTYSLPWIKSLGPANIQRHNLSLNATLRREMPRLGYPCITPEDAGGPIIAFSVKDDKATAARLTAKKIDVSLYPGRMRVSPSIYNTEADVQALLAALS